MRIRCLSSVSPFAGAELVPAQSYGVHLELPARGFVLVAGDPPVTGDRHVTMVPFAFIVALFAPANQLAVRPQPSPGAHRVCLLVAQPPIVFEDDHDRTGAAQRLA